MKTSWQGLKKTLPLELIGDTNVQNKPVTISPQQAADIEANNAKRSYPQADEDKLSGIEENATIGAVGVPLVIID